MKSDSSFLKNIFLYNYREFEAIYDYLDHEFNIYTGYQKANLCEWFSYAVEKQDSREGSLLAKDNEEMF